MPFNIERSAAFYDKEILKYPKGFEAVRNAVIDATTIDPTVGSGTETGGRFIVEAGTVMVASGDKVAPAGAGIDAEDVKGILAYTVELFGNADASYDEPCALFFDDCIFNSAELVGYSGNEAAVKEALSQSSFE
jgi:hypothetical protein